VWNFGEHITLSQMTYKTGFIVQGNTEDEKIVNTEDKWLVIHNKAYSAIPFGPISFNTL
jgi:hypothetical protein